MRIHFFKAPFYFAFIWFKVQGSGLSWRLRRLFRRWYSCIAALPEGADRAQAA